MSYKEGEGYHKRLWAGVSIVLGSFLLLEHLFSWGEFTFFDFIGHEWLGFLCILVGLSLGMNWKKPPSLGEDLKYNFKKDILDRFKRS